MKASSSLPLRHWEYYPQTYVAYRVSEPVVIDGDLTKPVWEKAPWSTPFGDIQGDDAPSDAYAPAWTQFKALYDDTYLYIGALLHPSPDFPTQAHYTERNSPIYQRDSDFEVFLDATLSNCFYKEFEVNALNTVWNLMLDKPYRDGGREHSGRQHVPGDDDYYEVHDQTSATRILQGKLNQDGVLWSVEVRMAYTDLLAHTGRFPEPPVVGDLWRLNLSRVELKGQVNWTWQPQVVWNGTRFGGVVDIHLPDAWGYLAFGTAHQDPLWPARLTAMHIYYAQHCYKEEMGKFASSTEELRPWTDETIVKPFKDDIRIEIPSEDGILLDSFRVYVSMDESTVLVRDDRWMQIV